MESCNSIRTPLEAWLHLDKDGSGELVDASTYQSLVGSFRFFTSTRPDIAFGVGLISIFMETPRQAQWQAAKRILRYVKGTCNEGILYEAGDNKCNLVGLFDSDWAGNMEDKKRTTGYVFHRGSGMIFWSSKKQQVVALSTIEVEYMVATSCATQAVWLRRVLEEMNHKQAHPTMIF